MTQALPNIPTIKKRCWKTINTIRTLTDGNFWEVVKFAISRFLANVYIQKRFNFGSIWFLYDLKITRTSLDVSFLFAFNERSNCWSLCKLMYLLSLLLAVNVIIIKQHLLNVIRFTKSRCSTTVWKTWEDHAITRHRIRHYEQCGQYEKACYIYISAFASIF